MRPLLWPPRAGDVIFVRGDGWLDRTIMRVQARKAKDGESRWSHCMMMADARDVFTTTTGRTGRVGLAMDFAGSEILIVRWIGMTPEAHARGMAAVAHQEGKMYPYGRLLCHLFGIERYGKADAMECSQLTATYLQAAGFPLGNMPISYDSDRLPDEMLSHVPSGGVQVVFEGSMRAAGLVCGNGPDNALVI
jgi:hypothetical protein